MLPILSLCWTCRCQFINIRTKVDKRNTEANLSSRRHSCPGRADTRRILCWPLLTFLQPPTPSQRRREFPGSLQGWRRRGRRGGRGMLSSWLLWSYFSPSESFSFIARLDSLHANMTFRIYVMCWVSGWHRVLTFPTSIWILRKKVI